MELLDPTMFADWLQEHNKPESVRYYLGGPAVPANVVELNEVNMTFTTREINLLIAALRSYH